MPQATNSFKGQIHNIIHFDSAEPQISHVATEVIRVVRRQRRSPGGNHH